MCLTGENQIVSRWKEKILHIPDIPNTEVKCSKLRFLALLIFFMNGILTGLHTMAQGCPRSPFVGVRRAGRPRAPCSLTSD